MKEIINNIIYMARRFRLATTFNMIGLIAAYALFYLLMTQLIYQYTYNHSVEDYERMYRLESDFVYNEYDYSDIVCRPFADALRHSPEVESYSIYQDVKVGLDSFEFKNAKAIMKFPYTIGNNTVVSTLTNKKLSGNLTLAEDDAYGIIIPKSAALQYFDSIDVAGKEMTLFYHGEEYPYIVRGVYEDFPEECEFYNRIFGNLLEDYKDSYNSLFKCYVKFKHVPDNMDAFCEKFKQDILTDLDEMNKSSRIVEEYDSLKHSITETRFRLTPIGETYFAHTTYTSDSGAKGYQNNFLILALGTLFVIFIAATNFLNFTLAESPMRVRGINTRLVLGASRNRLRMRLVAECVIVSVTAFLIALLLCQLLTHLPSLNQMLEGDISPMRNKLTAACLLLLSVVVGVLAGTYPAIFATSFAPAIALKSSFGLTPQGVRLRTVLVCVQLFLSILMFIYIGILLLQTHYIFNAEYGFEKDDILSTYIPYDTPDEVKHLMCQELAQIEGIEGVSLSDTQLGSTDSHNLLRSDILNHSIRYRFITTDNNYLRTMGIKIIEGRDFEESDTAAVIINKAAREQFPELQFGTLISTGIDEEVGDSAIFVGVCDSIHYGTMRINSDQMFFFISKPNHPYFQYVTTRIAPDANHRKVYQQVDETIKKHIKSMPTKTYSFDDNLNKTYHNEFRFFRQTYLISIICLLLTLIGTFCLTMFETEYRRKEIGIRKVAGATTGEIVWMLARRYGNYIIICFIAAAPIAYLCGRQTIRYFADRTPIYWWIYPLALLIVGGITIGTVVLQSWRAARENPVNSIKTE